MEAKVIFEFNNPYELARLLSLINDGKRILSHQGRTQRGIDGYTDSDLSKWSKVINQSTNVRCEFADGDFDGEITSRAEKEEERKRKKFEQTLDTINP